MNLAEYAGLVAGYLFGLIFFCLSYIRQARVFHPHGQLFEAKVESEVFYPHAIVRFSSAWWKFKEWPDILGITVRFNQLPSVSMINIESHQDLLFCSFSNWWNFPLAPLLTNHKDYFKNEYFAVLPFLHKGEIKRFKLIPKNSVQTKGSRAEKLQEAVLEGEAIFILQEMTNSKNSWKSIAELKLTRALNYDQEALRFNPFQNGLNIKPVGFVQHLRIGAYKLSQWARPSKEESDK